MDFSFTESLMARFCHDIIGPIGAISNGSEFFRDEFPELKSQAVDLIENSGKEAVARVQFYRQAYGILPDGVANFDDMKKLVEDFFKTTKAKIEWHGAEMQITNLQKKLMLNLLILANSSLIRGGIINTTLGSKEIKLTAIGDRAAFNEEVAKTLQGSGQQDAKTIQAYYTQQLAQNNGYKINVTSEKDSVIFSLVM